MVGNKKTTKADIRFNFLCLLWYLLAQRTMTTTQQMIHTDARVLNVAAIVLLLAEGVAGA